MGDALRHHGEAGEIYAEPQGAVVLGTRGGSLEKRGHLVMAADLRLDNRRDLLMQLPVLSPAASCTEIVLTAWERWGENCLTRLEGRFSIILWDELARRLYCASDFLASRPLFYFHREREYLAVATEPRALMVAGAPCELNLRKFALLGTLLGAARDEETAFQGISALKASTILSFDSEHLKLRSYWSTDSLGRMEGPKTDTEWIEACRHAFDEAVKCRLPSSGEFTLLLSGGLDSSAVAVTVARITGQPLQAASSVCGSETEPVQDERRYISLLGETIKPNWVTCDSAGPFDDLGRLVWLTASPLATSRHYVYANLAGATSNRVLLEGNLGEWGPTHPGTGYLAAALLKGQIFPVIKECLALSRAGEGSLGRVVWRELIRPFVPPGILQAVGRGPQVGGLPLKADFMREILGAELDEAVHWTRALVSPGADPRRSITRLISVAFGQLSGRFVGDERYDRRFPFQDRRLLDVCLSAPPLTHIRGGYRRSQIREMMKDRLPDGIRLRRDKHPFSPGYTAHYESQRGYLRSFLESIPQGHFARSVLDLDEIARLIQRPAQGPRDGRALHLVPLSIYTLVFLLNFHRFSDPLKDRGFDWIQPLPPRESGSD